jgi:hypothetical protein
MSLPKCFNDLCIKLDNTHNFKNILLVRHPSGGFFLNNLFLNKKNVTRILYKTICFKQDDFKNSPYTLVEHSELKKVIGSCNKKFDLICLDPFHEYYESINDIKLLTSFLTDNGILVCHDCGYSRKEFHVPRFKPNEWCGVTYYCLVEFAYNNPDYYYGVINADFGLGVISKKKLPHLKKINNEKQKILIDIFKRNKDEAYDYFVTHAKELINLID